MTTLAEETASDLGRNEWLDDEHHEIWDIALEFFDAQERKANDMPR